MAAKDAFDPKVFLAKVGEGKAVLKFIKNQHIFEQGDVADKVLHSTMPPVIGLTWG